MMEYSDHLLIVFMILGIFCIFCFYFFTFVKRLYSKVIERNRYFLEFFPSLYTFIIFFILFATPVTSDVRPFLKDQNQLFYSRIFSFKVVFLNEDPSNYVSPFISFSEVIRYDVSYSDKLVEVVALNSKNNTYRYLAKYSNNSSRIFLEPNQIPVEINIRGFKVWEYFDEGNKIFHSFKSDEMPLTPIYNNDLVLNKIIYPKG